MAFVLGILVIGGAIYLSPVISGTTTSLTGSTAQQTTTSLQTTQSMVTNTTTTQRFVPTPETVETTNSTLGLELALSINSTGVPGNDAINVATSIFNTLPTANNLTASNNWKIQYLLSGPCDFGNWTLDPEGIAIFRGYYEMNNISSATPIPVWARIECVVPTVGNNTNVYTLKNITSYSFLPKNDSGYLAADYYLSSEIIAKGVFSTQMSAGDITIWASNNSGFFNSLESSSPATYTLVAGDEWGQIVLLHFQVISSDNLPTVGSFVASGSGGGGCAVNNSPTFCTTTYLSQALELNCANAAATPSGCTVRVPTAGSLVTMTLQRSSTTITTIVGYTQTSYSLTAWYPYANQTSEPSGKNCEFSISGDPNSPYFGVCFMTNTTAFVISSPS